MSNSNEYQQISVWSKIWKQGTQKVEVEMWDQILKQLVKTEIQITINKDKSIIYQYDGVILRKDSFKFQPKNPFFLTNMGMIKYLQWQIVEDDKKKLVKWMANWNGEALIEVGGYFEDGVKLGFWQESIKYYSCKSQLYQKGQYVNDQQRGIWKYTCNNNMIGGGQYNLQGVKVGKWIELDDYFKENSQVIYNGEFKNGKKIGIWETVYQGKQIGGGLYFESKGEQVKTGKWCELSNGFMDTSQVTYIGVYKDGKKLGRWDVWWLQDKQQQVIGGGLYDDIDSIKIGQWIEVSDMFKKDSQVTFIGEYKNGMKIGKWNILQKHELIGGGSYNLGSSQKNGKWIELSDRFESNSQVIYNGQYNNGQKVGRWDILFREEDGFFKIGGGSYDQVSSLKIGKWIELSQSFNLYSQVTFIGQYKDGKKVGKWTTWFRDFRNGRNLQIGGGLYDEDSSIKVGKWTELSDGFHFLSQVTQTGEYKYGQKVGKWNIMYKQYEDSSFQQIGGGLYDKEYSIKIGRWIELSDGFYKWSQLVYKGEYMNGRKVGAWDIEYEGIKIGGGQYDEQFSMKIGSWIEPSDDFYVDFQVIYNGIYKNGKKIGRWDIIFRFSINNSFKQIAGGQYEEGMKIGDWVELCDEFNKDYQIVCNGEYKNNKKVGKWAKMDISRKR
ncbi:unnamed protein product [Paramecium primaurelia]|uniref:Uncharacterized protein n=1 Tax=Paramecium primaurelia TaxID=5886 RepID=A0A8S1PFA5_PARPR|nr:unnamed protein product [Paramecium primaurelia]